MKHPLDFEVPQTNKPIIALDIDEVLFPFVEQLCKWMQRDRGSTWTHRDFFSYRFRDVWKCSEEEAFDIVYEYFETEEFKNAPPIPSSVKAVRELAEHFCIVAVTARQLFLEETTRSWLKLHYGDTITDACFGNHWVKDKAATGEAPMQVKKVDFCKKLGAVALVDDNPNYVLEVAPVVDRCILLNIQNANGWGLSMTVPRELNNTIATCLSWDAVVEQLLPLAKK